MQIRDSKPVIVGVGTFMAASLGVTLSASIDEDANDLFVAASLDDIDVLTADDDDEEEASCGEGQCGGDDDGDDEGECGEGECGEDGENEDDEDGEDEDADDEEESTEE